MQVKPMTDQRLTDAIARLYEDEAEIARLRDQIAAKDEALHRIRQWADAYPTDIFPEIDTDAIKAQIGENAYAALHASWARHIMDGVKRIASAALSAEQTSGSKRHDERERAATPSQHATPAGDEKCQSRTIR